MSIRGIGETVSILDCTDDRNHKRIGERQLPMALRELFPNSVYLLGGRKYESIVLDLRSGVLLARVRQLPDKHPYKTEALRHDEPEIIRMLERRIVNGLETEYCDLTITEVIDGYVVKEIFSDKMVGPMHFLPNPLSYTYETKGLVFRAPRPVKLSASMMEKNSSMGEEVTIDDVLAGSYHALEHTLIESSDSLTGSGSSEIGGVSMSPSGAIFVYDGSPGGSGLTKLLFDRLEEAFQRTLTILKECRCESKNGCPMCTYSYQCGNNNNPLCKSGAIDSLEQIAKGASTKIDSKFTGEKALL
jgi:DEAD/DEAH box helicase domain-containing protein